MSLVTRGQRLYLGAVAALALWVGIWCFFVPAGSAKAIPWLVPPLCAAFLGAMYLSGAAFCGLSMLAGRWVEVRVIMPLIALWTGGLNVISFFYLPAFDWARPQVWIWFGAYALYPAIAVWLLWVKRAERHSHPLGEPAIPAWARRYLRPAVPLPPGHRYSWLQELDFRNSDAHMYFTQLVGEKLPYRLVHVSAPGRFWPAVHIHDSLNEPVWIFERMP